MAVHVKQNFALLLVQSVLLLIHSVLVLVLACHAEPCRCALRRMALHQR